MCTDHVLVWSLRVYKLFLMEAAGLTTEQREHDVRNPDAVSLSYSTSGARDKLSVAFAVKAAFTVTKV